MHAGQVNSAEVINWIVFEDCVQGKAQALAAAGAATAVEGTCGITLAMKAADTDGWELERTTGEHVPCKFNVGIHEHMKIRLPWVASMVRGAFGGGGGERPPPPCVYPYRNPTPIMLLPPVPRVLARMTGRSTTHLGSSSLLLCLPRDLFLHVLLLRVVVAEDVGGLTCCGRCCSQGQSSLFGCDLL